MQPGGLPARQPMAPALRPMTLVDILDGTFKLWRRAWKPLALLALVLAVPSALLSGLVQAASYDFGRQASPWAMLFSGDLGAIENSAAQPFSTSAIAVIIASVVLSILLGLVVQPLIYGAIARVVAARHMGRTLSAGPALRGAFRHTWALIAGTVLFGLAVLVGLFFLIIGVVVPLTLFSAYVAVIVTEDVGPIKALERSATLLYRRFWWYLLTLFLINFLVYIIGNILTVPFLVGSFVASALEIYFLEWALVAMGSLLSVMIILPTAVITSVLIYFDARVRFEGLDLQVNTPNHTVSP